MFKTQAEQKSVKRVQVLLSFFFFKTASTKKIPMYEQGLEGRSTPKSLQGIKIEPEWMSLAVFWTGIEYLFVDE